MAKIFFYRPETPSLGDFWIFPKSDAAGRYNRLHRHTNFGYSGYVVILVHNGSNWCQVTKSGLASLGLSDTHFSYRYEAEGLKASIVRSIRQFTRSTSYFIEYWPWKRRLYAELVPVVEQERIAA